MVFAENGKITVILSVVRANGVRKVLLTFLASCISSALVKKTDSL